MSWQPRIESLRQFVIWECRDIPPDYVLSIIQHESRGVPGIMGKRKTHCGDVVDIDGQSHNVCAAMGLMQVIPSTLAGYNAGKTGANVATLEDMTGTDDRAKRMQIRAGCWYLGAANSMLHRRFPDIFSANISEASDDQLMLLLTAYAVGAGATAEKLSALHDQGKRPNFKNIKKYFPSWGKNDAGKWINRPLSFADNVFNNYLANRVGSYPDVRPGDIIARIKTHKKKLLGSAIAILLISFAVNRYYITPRGKK